MTFVNCTIRLLHYVNAVLELLASGLFFFFLFINPSLAVWPDHFLNAGVTGNSVPPPPPPPLFGPPPDRNPWMHKTNYPGPKSLDVVIYTFVLVHKKYTDRSSGRHRVVWTVWPSMYVYRFPRQIMHAWVCSSIVIAVVNNLFLNLIQTFS